MPGSLLGSRQWGLLTENVRAWDGQSHVAPLATGQRWTERVRRGRRPGAQFRTWSFRRHLRTRGDVGRASGLARLPPRAVPGARDADEGGQRGDGPLQTGGAARVSPQLEKGQGPGGARPTRGFAAIRAQGEGRELGRRLESLRGVTETHGTRTRVTPTDRDKERLGSRRWSWSARPATWTRAASTEWVRGVPG